jgi:hypothetical protein
MALSIFNRKPAAPDVTPNRTAFDAARRAYLEKAKERLAVLQKAGEMQRHTRAADAAAAKVAALRADVDAGVAAALLDGAPAPDLEDRKRDLAAAEKDAAQWVPIARAADIAHRRFSTEVADLTRQEQELYAPIKQLAHPVFYEDELAALATDFREKEEAFREVHRRVFVMARAADKLAQQCGVGLFRGSAEYDFLHITRPAHPDYWRGSKDPWTIKLQADAAAVALDREADALIHELLTSEPA